MLNGYSLDKNHTFLVNLAADLSQYNKIDDKWTRPVPRPYKDLGNLRSWLTNPKGQDQFVVHYEDDKVHTPSRAIANPNKGGHCRLPCSGTPPRTRSPSRW